MASSRKCGESRRERLFYWQPTRLDPLNHRDDSGGPALHHEGLNFLFQVALYLPYNSFEFEFPLPGNLISTFQQVEDLPARGDARGIRWLGRESAGGAVTPPLTYLRVES